MALAGNMSDAIPQPIVVLTASEASTTSNIARSSINTVSSQGELVTITGPVQYANQMISTQTLATRPSHASLLMKTTPDSVKEDEEEEETVHHCKECDKVFATKRELLHHTYIHKENPKYICPVCSKMFPSEPGYKRHVRAHQNRIRRKVPCNICAMMFSCRSLLEKHHRENHLNEKLFQCEVCRAQFSWQDNLKKHMRMHVVGNVNVIPKSDVGTIYKCEECDAKFLDDTSLRIHTRQHRELLTKANDKLFTCKVCGKMFQFDFSYKAHMNAHEARPIAKRLKEASPNTPAENRQKALGSVHMISSQESTVTADGKVITEIELPEGQKDVVVQIKKPNSQVSDSGVASDNSFQFPKDGESVVEKPDNKDFMDTCEEQPLYGVTYTPPLDAKTDKDNPQFTVINDRRFVKTPFKGGRARAVKNEKRKRATQPIIYHLPMTDERPFACSYCDSSFRWEVSRRIHEREHIDTYDVTNKTPRGRPRIDPSKDFTYRIVRRRDSDSEEEEYEVIKGGGMRKKRRYRKKKDVERVQQAFNTVPTLPPQQQVTTVVRLTRKSLPEETTSPPQQVTTPVVPPKIIAVNSQGMQFEMVENS